jgi:hypothetical protein
MAVVINLDFSQVLKNVPILNDKVRNATDKAVNKIADEILRLSQREVPHDTGRLQNTGDVKSVKEMEAEVRYSTPYAARLHEHPEYNFQKGRKGKYLEDPVKNNTHVFTNYMKEIVGEVFK